MTPTGSSSRPTRLSVDGLQSRPAPGVSRQPWSAQTAKSTPAAPHQTLTPQLARHKPATRVTASSARVADTAMSGTPPKQPVPAPVPTRAQSQPIPARRTAWQRLQSPLIIIGCMIAGFAVQTLTLGLIAIAIYGVLALIFRVYSRTTFTLALISLLAVPIILVVKQNSEVASNFATYTFLLIVIGIIALIRESPDSGHKYLHIKKQ
jgi:hypothetical protein